MNHVGVPAVDHTTPSQALFVRLNPEPTDDVSVELLLLERRDCDTSGSGGGANTRGARFQKMFYRCR